MFALLFIVALAVSAYAAPRYAVAAKSDTAETVFANGIKTIIMAICLMAIILPWFPLSYDTSYLLQIGVYVVIAFFIVLLLNSMKDSSTIWGILIVGAFIVIAGV